ncbi:MAG: 7-carboxy-7-deazaguanine synthase [Pseudomonadota bacterium]
MYSIKEIFYTLQGEGAHTGRAAVFCRFAGCNLWSGLEQHRANAICRFCDTQFVGTDGEGGGKFATAELLVSAIMASWNQGNQSSAYQPRFVVLTGGEPLLQVDNDLIEALNTHGFEVAIETNGTQPPPTRGQYWLTVSPKSTAPLNITSGDELKLVYPQADALPEAFENLNFKHFFLQPMDNEKIVQNTQATLDYCRQHPKWRLSLQTHKILNIP